MVTGVALRTLLTEPERVLNGRALTANSDDQSDFKPLSHAHVLMQRKVICCHLESSTCTRGNGDKFSLLLICSGKGGLKSISLVFILELNGERC